MLRKVVDKQRVESASPKSRNTLKRFFRAVLECGHSVERSSEPKDTCDCKVCDDLKDGSILVEGNDVYSWDIEKDQIRVDHCGSAQEAEARRDLYIAEQDNIRRQIRDTVRAANNGRGPDRDRDPS